tara:strand:+ start:385 stop:621 length:237 start_codon:yes stop_codon:yes gene_type:complete
MKKDNLSDGEKHALFLMSLVNPDLYPNKTKIIPVELKSKNGKSIYEFTLVGLIGLINLAFHILQHEYDDVILEEKYEV